ncbi:MAG: alpha/beta hydrolase [Ktedonobacteraceae bacterium]
MTDILEGERRIQVNGLTFRVIDRGSGPAVLLIHGWPDSVYLWRHQIPVLVDAGYRVIVPDLPGFGQSDRPTEVNAYKVRAILGYLKSILATLGVERVRIVGHDWGAGIAWFFTTNFPTEVEQLVALSVGHPIAAREDGLKQWEKHWYFLWFLFPGVVEAAFPRNNWALFREFLHDQGDIEHYIEDLSRPGALAATLNMYRANVSPTGIGADAPALPPIQCPTLGIWGSEDFSMSESQMQNSGKYVKGLWQYERIEGAGHWLSTEVPERINTLLLDFLRKPA